MDSPGFSPYKTLHEFKRFAPGYKKAIPEAASDRDG
jgi:hypothetical protein